MQVPEALEALLRKNIEFTQELYEELGGMIYSLAAFYTNDLSLREDLMQEGWIGVQIACNQYVEDFGASLKTYAHQRARRKMQYYMQYHAWLVHVPIEHREGYSTEMMEVESDEWHDGKESYAFLEDAINELDHGDIIRMYYLDEISMPGIALETGICRNRISAILKAGIKELRELLT
jgi:RNA polymerase sigma factor (sigma-70 family)